MLTYPFNSLSVFEVILIFEKCFDNLEIIDFLVDLFVLEEVFPGNLSRILVSHLIDLEHSLKHRAVS